MKRPRWILGLLCLAITLGASLLVDVPCTDCGGEGKVLLAFGGPLHSKYWGCRGCQGWGRKPIAVHWIRSLLD